MAKRKSRKSKRGRPKSRRGSRKAKSKKGSGRRKKSKKGSRRGSRKAKSKKGSRRGSRKAKSKKGSRRRKSKSGSRRRKKSKKGSRRGSRKAKSKKGSRSRKSKSGRRKSKGRPKSRKGRSRHKPAAARPPSPRRTYVNNALVAPLIQAVAPLIQAAAQPGVPPVIPMVAPPAVAPPVAPPAVAPPAVAPPVLPPPIQAALLNASRQINRLSQDQKTPERMGNILAENVAAVNGKPPSPEQKQLAQEVANLAIQAGNAKNATMVLQDVEQIARNIKLMEQHLKTPSILSKNPEAAHVSADIVNAAVNAENKVGGNNADKGQSWLARAGQGLANLGVNLGTLAANAVANVIGMAKANDAQVDAANAAAGEAVSNGASQKQVVDMAVEAALAVSPSRNVQAPVQVENVVQAAQNAVADVVNNLPPAQKTPENVANIAAEVAAEVVGQKAPSPKEKTAAAAIVDAAVDNNVPPAAAAAQAVGASLEAGPISSRLHERPNRGKRGEGGGGTLPAKLPKARKSPSPVKPSQVTESKRAASPGVTVYASFILQKAPFSDPTAYEDVTVANFGKDKFPQEIQNILNDIRDDIKIEMEFVRKRSKYIEVKLINSSANLTGEILAEKINTYLSSHGYNIDSSNNGDVHLKVGTVKITVVKNRESLRNARR